MRIGVTGLSAVAVLIVALGSARAQMPPGPPPPAPGFVSSFEIVHTLRAAGFDPLAPPLREGTIYVARATDYRGIPMRVVLDARTGAIRDANRIVPGPGNYVPPYGPYGEAADPYGRPLYGPGPYGPADADEADEDDGPPSYGRVGAIPLPYGGLPNRPPMSGVAPLPPHAATGVSAPPLPRPRPPELAARQQADIAKPAEIAKPPAADPKPSVAVDPPKPDVKASAPPVSAPAAAAASTAPAAPARKPPSTLTINN